MKILEHAFKLDDFENHLNGAIGGIIREYIKWKTAEHLGIDKHGWDSETESLINDFVNWYFDHSIRTVRVLKGDQALKKKRKALKQVFAHARDSSRTYYARALTDLNKKTPDYGKPIRQQELPIGAVEEVILWITKEIEQVSKQIDNFGLPKNS